MASYLITSSTGAPVDLYLVQGRELGALEEALKLEPLFAEKILQLWEMKPDLGSQPPNGCGAIHLNEINISTTNAAEQLFRSALWYARINGHCNEVDVLRQFGTILLDHLRDAQTREAKHQSNPKEVTNPTEASPTGK